MKIRKTDNQLFLEKNEKTFSGKELSIQILGSGIGVTELAAGTIVVFEFSRSVHYIFQLKKAVELLSATGATYIYYLAGSVVNLDTGLPEDTILYAPSLKKCRLPTILELEQYENFSTV